MGVRVCASKKTMPYPKCLLCNTLTEPDMILDSEEFMIRGWKCPKCSFTLIHTNEIQKALLLLRKIKKDSPLKIESLK